jgi:hypothetical protein
MRETAGPLVAPPLHPPGRLGLREFLADIQGVTAHPARRFALIRERGALWGSLVLLFAPAYFVFHFAGGVFFDRDPFPGYAFLAPLVPAVGVGLAKYYAIHFFARLLEGNGTYRRGSGRYRDLLAVAGYTNLPNIVAFTFAIFFFLFLPAQLGVLLHSFRAATLSVLIACGVVLFVWAVILMVLALRAVYRMRDAKVFGALVLGAAASAGIGFGTVRALHPVKVQIQYVTPILSERFRQFLSPEPLSPSGRVTMDMQFDAISYRFKSPARFDVVACGSAAAKPGGVIVGRIVGFPGEVVELRGGVLVIDGRAWSEPHIPPEFQTPVSLEPLRIEPGHYLVLPEDRNLVDRLRPRLLVPASEILGRRAIKKWPFGWLEFRSTAFLKGEPK